MGCRFIATAIVFSVLSTTALAQQADQSDPIDYEAVAALVETAETAAAGEPQEPQPDPSQGDFPNTFIPRRKSPSPATNQAVELDDARRKQLEEMRRAQQKMLEEQQRALEERQRAMHEAERAFQRIPRQLQMERDALAKEVEMLRQQVKLAQQQARASVPVPVDAATKVFALRHAKAHDMTHVLNDILGGRNLRMGVDQRSNSLIVSADDKTIDIVAALLMKLDESTAAPITEPGPSESLQLRVVWLLDGLREGEGKKPTANVVSPSVINALKELGFENPRVVCQQGTTMTLGPNNRRGEFQFEIPVLINAQRWQLEGQGVIMPMASDRFNLQFKLQYHQTNVGRDGDPMRGQLGGSIYTPLGHYTVMGTTTFVGSTAPAGALLDPTGMGHPDPAMGMEGGYKPQQQQQHQSAFVVYLDRATGYSSTTEKGDDLAPGQ